MKKIAIPTDLTLHSLSLIRHALHLLKGETCRITLVHPFPLPDSITELLLLPREEDREGKASPSFTRALERLEKSHAVEIEGIGVTRLYCDSSVQVNGFILDNGIDLVLSPVALGRIASDDPIRLFNSLLHDAPCPVLYMPEYFGADRLRRVAFVVDAENSPNALPDSGLVDLLCGADCHVTFLAVFKPGTDMDALRPVFDCVYSSESLRGISCSLHLIREHDVTEGVVSFIDRYGVDLVVTCKKKSLLGRLGLGSGKRLNTKVIRSRVPFLSIG